MSEAIGIGFFQFDNLLKNRVPCVFFVFESDLSSICSSQEIEHIQRYQLDHLRPVDQLEEKKFRKIDPILCLCEDGIKSQNLADQLGRQGYLNAYFVLGGLVQLRKEQNTKGL